jgi:hypothetical protein
LIRILKTLAQVAFVVVLAACGSSNNNSSNASMRLVNATTAATLTLSLNGSAQFSNIPAHSASPYASIGPGTYTITVTAAGGTVTSSTQTFGVGSAQTYSLLAYDRDGSLFTAFVTENETAPASGFGVLGLANLSPDSGALDVYVVAPGASISGLAPTFQNVQNGAPSVGSTVAVGSYDIIATGVGSPADVRFTASSVSVGNGQIESLALTSTPGGGLVNGVFLIQTGPVRFEPNTNARVRVVSALPVAGSSQVVGTVGSTSLASVFSPNPGRYTLVAGGASTYSITVSGTAVAGLPAATFTTGGDFTILVYGTVPATPSVSVFTDNNQAPLSGQVNMRLVNAGANVTGGVTMYVNGLQVASSVAYGAASPYAGVGVTAAAVLQLIQAGGTPVNTPIALSTPGAVYTVFVIDSTLTPYLIRDR